MSNRDGKGPNGDVRPGKGLGPCSPRRKNKEDSFDSLSSPKRKRRGKR